MKKTNYRLGKDSLAQHGVPSGRVEKRRLETSRIYPDTSHDYWVYVPDQYQDSEPVCVMFFQDGESYVDGEGSVRAPIVFDNLIHKREMPTCIGVFVNPASVDELFDQRSKEYTPLTDTYTRFLIEDLLVEISDEINVTDDREGHAICGMSDGGLCAFNAAWHRPDVFSKVVSHIGSFTRLRQGSEYPYLIRNTRSDPKPIRVFLQDGSNDINITEGSWSLANLAMASALMYARYDYRFELGTGGHDLEHGGAILPDTLRWLWRDFPNVGIERTGPSFELVEGEWELVVNYFGDERKHLLDIRRRGDDLSATLRNETDGDVEITTINFSDEVLSFEYSTPPSQINWGKGSHRNMIAWLKIDGESLEGALSMAEDIPMDVSVHGRRVKKPQKQNDTG